MRLLIPASTAFIFLTQAVLGASPVQFDIHRVSQSLPALRKRDEFSTPMTLFQSACYTVSVYIGEPAQKVELVLDTGSADMWVVSPDSPGCDNGACDSTGMFDNTLSKTNKVLNSSFDSLYADGSSSHGTYVTDNVRIGSVTIKNQQFGYATNTSNTVGILGVSQPNFEFNDEDYPNLPARLKSDGIIDLNCFSLWMNDLKNGVGSILFGAIDRAKYWGELEVIDMHALNYESEVSLSAQLTAIRVTHSTAKTETVYSNETDTDLGSLYTLLDSGTTLGMLPKTVLYNLAKNLLGKEPTLLESNYYQTPCSLADSSMIVEFELGGKASIKVRMTDLIRPITYGDGQETICGVGLMVTDSNAYILGDIVLSSAYMVYDLDNKQIGVGQTVNNATESDILVLGNEGIVGDLTGRQSTTSTATTSSTPVTSSASVITSSAGGGVSALYKVTSTVTTSTPSSSFSTSTLASTFNAAASAPTTTMVPNSGSKQSGSLKLAAALVVIAAVMCSL